MICLFPMFFGPRTFRPRSMRVSEISVAIKAQAFRRTHFRPGDSQGLETLGGCGFLYRIINILLNLTERLVMIVVGAPAINFLRRKGIGSVWGQQSRCPGLRRWRWTSGVGTLSGDNISGCMAPKRGGTSRARKVFFVPRSLAVSTSRLFRHLLAPAASLTLGCRPLRLW